MSELAVNGGRPVRTEPFPQWPVFGEEEKRLLLEVLESGKWGGTGRMKLPVLEQKFAALHDARHAVTTVNGTLAITVALLAAGVKPGDEVIVPPYTFIATATAALMIGAIPVFADVEEETLLLDPDRVEERITPRTKAIVAVHIAGAPADMARLKAIADRHGLRLIEDAAQAVGARWRDRGVGAIGDLGTFSFQSSKNLTAGEGGIILTNDPELAEIAWSVCNVGRRPGGEWYEHVRVGWNLRMTEFQAAVLLAQLNRLEEQMECRERNAAWLTERLNAIPGLRVIGQHPDTTRHARHIFMFRLDGQAAESIDKRDFLRKLNAEGIPASPGYISLNRNPTIVSAVRQLTGEERIDPCPVSERACEREVIWLSQNVLLGSERDMEDVVLALEKVMKTYGTRM